jgi:Uma2 family endonuclease
MLEKIATELMTLDEFIAEYHAQPFELVNGEKRFIMPNVMIHQLFLKALFLLLHTYTQAHKLGEVLFELPFVELYKSQWVKGSRTPDLMFVAAAKWAEYTTATNNWLLKPAVFIPDLAIEIVSPNDSYSEIEEKVEEYLEKGVQLVWIFDPQRQRVTTYQAEQIIKLGKNDTLTGGDVLPGLAIQLSEIFTS